MWRVFGVRRELYSHEASPVPKGDFDYEAENLVDLPEHADLVKQLSQQLHAGWRWALPATRHAESGSAS